MAARRDHNPFVVLIFLSLGFFMILLDTTIVNIAIPSLVTDLKASLDSILWVLNGYILAYAVLLITAGRLGDLFGQKRLFLTGLVVFVLSSAACGAAQSTDQLIAARVVQGVGGAVLTPQTLSIITTIFPSDRRGAAFGIWGAVAGIAAIAGPTVGGFLVTYQSWRWIFYINVPVGIVTFIGGWIIIPDFRPGRRHGLDIRGVLVSTLSLFLITFGLIEGEKYSWGHVDSVFGAPMPGLVDIRLIIAMGVILQVLFFILERLSEEPLVPLSLFRDRNFALMNGVTAAVAFGMLGLFLPITIYLQSVLGFSAIKAGLTFIPMSLVSMPLAPFAGRLADRIGGKYILLVGLALFAAGFGLLDLQISDQADWYSFTLPILVAGLGLGCTFAPMAAVAMRNIGPRMAGAASGVFNTTRQLGAVLGSAIVGAVLQNRLAASFHDQAVARSSALPDAFRQSFIDSFSNAAKGGFQIGRGEVGGSLPAGLPPQVANSLTQVAHDVFVHGFIDAVRPTLMVSVVVLALAALGCLAIKRRGRGEAAEAPTSPAAAAS